jgi:hypothetical protein
MRYEGGEMKVLVGKTVFGMAYTVRLETAGYIFRTGFQGSETEAQNLATSIRKSINRSGTKKKGNA